MPYAKLMCTGIVSIFLKILKLSRTLQGLPGQKAPLCPPFLAYGKKKKGLSPRPPQVPKSRLKQLMIRTQQSQTPNSSWRDGGKNLMHISELFFRKDSPLTTQVEDGNVRLTTSNTETPDWLEPECRWLRFLTYHCYLTTNQSEGPRAIMHMKTVCLVFKKPFPESYWEVHIYIYIYYIYIYLFWVWAAHSPWLASLFCCKDHCQEFGFMGLPWWSSAGDMGSIPGPGRSHMPRSN